MVEKRVVFGPEDVSSIRMVCQKCDNEAVWRLTPESDTKLMPTKCPFCEADWANADIGLLMIVNDLRKLLGANGKAKRLKVRFEITR